MAARALAAGILVVAGGCHLLLPFSPSSEKAIDSRLADGSQAEAAEADHRSGDAGARERDFVAEASNKDSASPKVAIKRLYCTPAVVHEKTTTVQDTVSSNSTSAAQTLIVSVVHFGSAGTPVGPQVLAVSCTSCNLTRALLSGPSSYHLSAPQGGGFWYLTDAPPTATVKVTLGSPVAAIVVGCFFSGVSPTLPLQLNTVAMSISSNSSLAYSFTTETGAQVIDLVAWSPGTSASIGLKTLPSRNVDYLSVTLAQNWAGQSEVTAVGPSTPGQWSTQDGVKGNFTVAGLALRPAP